MNKGWTIAGIAALVVLLVRNMTKGATTTTTDSGSQVVQPSEADIRAAFARIVQAYGRDIARTVERIYRLETANFTSGQFRMCNTPGMVATSSSYPFGWSPRGLQPSDFAPVVEMRENQGGALKKFVAIRLFSNAAMFVAKVMFERGNDPGRWHTFAGTPSYRNAANAIATPIVDSL